MAPGTRHRWMKDFHIDGWRCKKCGMKRFQLLHRGRKTQRWSYLYPGEFDHRYPEHVPDCSQASPEKSEP